MSGYVAIEGIDGSGKTTVAEMLSDKLKATLVREPDESQWTGQAVREALQKETASMTDAFLFMADRAEHLERKVKPALEADQTVISDRSHLSTYAYQGPAVAEARETSIEEAYEFLRYTYSKWNVEPDVVILLQCPVGVALERSGRADKNETRGTLESAATGYAEQAEKRDDVYAFNTHKLSVKAVVDSAAEAIQAKI